MHTTTSWLALDENQHACIGLPFLGRSVHACHRPSPPSPPPPTTPPTQSKGAAPNNSDVAGGSPSAGAPTSLGPSGEHGGGTSSAREATLPSIGNNTGGGEPRQPFEATYQLGKELGHGSFSTVREGTHKVRGGEHWLLFNDTIRRGGRRAAGAKMEGGKERKLAHGPTARCWNRLLFETRNTLSKCLNNILQIYRMLCCCVGALCRANTTETFTCTSTVL